MSFVYSGFVEMTAKHPLGQPPEFKTGVAFCGRLERRLGALLVLCCRWRWCDLNLFQSSVIFLCAASRLTTEVEYQ